MKASSINEFVRLLKLALRMQALSHKSLTKSFRTLGLHICSSALGFQERYQTISYEVIQATSINWIYIYIDLTIYYTPRGRSTPWYTTCPIHPDWYEWGHGSSPAANSIEELINWYYSFALGVEASESLTNHISEHHPNQNKQLERVGTWPNVSKIIIWFALKTSMLHRACVTSLDIFFQRVCRRWCVCHSLLSGPAPRGRASGLFPLLAAAAGGWGAVRLGPLPIVHRAISIFLAPTQLPRLLQSLPARLRHQRQLRAHFAPRAFCSHFDQILRTGLCGPCLLGSTFCARTPEVLRASQLVGMTCGRKPWSQNSSALRPWIFQY